MLNAARESGKKREIPHIFAILLCVIIIATIATYIVPAGKYERVMDTASKRMVIDPGSFQYVDQSPVNPLEMFVSIEMGLIEASNISFLILAAFSCLFLIEKTGAIDAGIAALVRKTQDKPNSTNVIMIVLIVLFSVWGSTGTLSYEEIIAFAPFFVAVSVALGYDALVGIGISVVPVGIGFASATVNPFTIGVAQTISELPMFSGLEFRIVILCVMTLATVLYVMRYANMVKKNPEKSYVADIDYSDIVIDEKRMNTPMTAQRKISLLVLVAGVCYMSFGLIKMGWYINQCAAVFMIISIVVGFVNRWRVNQIASVLTEGLSKGVLSAVVVGIARGILVVVTRGNIIDTIVHSCVALMESVSLYASALGMLAFQTLLNFLVPSGSGQAAVSMPIITPIADLLHLNRQIAVLIFQFGDGFSNLLWPTSFMLIVCAMVKIPVSRYYKWLIPFFLITLVLQIAFVFAAVAMNYGPF
ncbi:MAG: TIGR00366 family protein [Synergistaceae bacterium]|jgi:uncharacterized ion transporter superfamily protein YfcC|nr:TIGR00366 family protein [Synergistaceae bacterium]